MKRLTLACGLLAAAPANAADLYAVYSWIPNPQTRNQYPSIEQDDVKDHPIAKLKLAKRPNDGTLSAGKWTLELTLPDTMTGGTSSVATLEQSGNVMESGAYRMAGPVGKMDCYIDETDLGSTSCENLELTGLPGTQQERVAFKNKYYKGTTLEEGMDAQARIMHSEPFGDLNFREYDEYSSWALTYSGAWNSRYQTPNGNWVDAPMRLNAEGGAYHPAGNQGGVFRDVYWDTETQTLFIEWEFGPSGAARGWVELKPMNGNALQGSWGRWDEDGSRGPVVGQWNATR